MEGVKLMLYVEHTVDPEDLPVALWRFCNNMDPKRDSVLYEGRSAAHPGLKIAIMGLDGTIKTKRFDDFQRNWPNIVASSEETIAAVDAKWSELGIGPLIASPSLKFRKQLYGEEAVAD
jgi:4-hydroxy-3-polyprenylbenzoate decarboxylase